MRSFGISVFTTLACALLASAAPFVPGDVVDVDGPLVKTGDITIVKGNQNQRRVHHHDDLVDIESVVGGIDTTLVKGEQHQRRGGHAGDVVDIESVIGGIDTTLVKGEQHQRDIIDVESYVDGVKTTLVKGEQHQREVVDAESTVKGVKTTLVDGKQTQRRDGESIIGIVVDTTNQIQPLCDQLSAFFLSFPLLLCAGD